MANQFPLRQHQNYRLDVALEHIMDTCEDGPHRAALTHLFSAMKAEYLLILDALLSPGVVITPLVVHRLQNLNRHLSFMYLNPPNPRQNRQQPRPGPAL
jgi:hypothetical protein